MNMIFWINYYLKPNSLLEFLEQLELLINLCALLEIQIMALDVKITCALTSLLLL